MLITSGFVLSVIALSVEAEAQFRGKGLSANYGSTVSYYFCVLRFLTKICYRISMIFKTRW
jgi:hypothetical protein